MPDIPRGRARAAIVSLLTDFGLSDPYVGTMKAVMLGINPRLTFVDLTHGIAPQQVPQGSLALEAAWPYCPEGTTHLAVVDPGVGSARLPIAVRAGGHTFVGPDNGLFSRIFDGFPDAEVRRIEAAAYRLEPVSRTFHGRDIFAPAAAWLTRGVPFDRLGPCHDAPVRLEQLSPRRFEGGWRGEVVYVDAFGNLVTNLPSSLVGPEPALDAWEIELCGQTIALTRTYSDVEVGALAALVGSFEVIEVAVNGGSARGRLGAGVGSSVRLLRRGPTLDRSGKGEASDT